MANYLMRIDGIGVQGTTGLCMPEVFYEAEADSDAIQRGSRISSGIGVAHGITIYKARGKMVGKEVISRNCGAGECW